MRSARRFPQRLVRWTSLGVSLALVLSCFILTPLSNPHTSLTVLAQGQDSRNGKAKKEKPVTGPPAASLPNLDEVKRRGREAPRVPQHVPSTLRSRRKPLEPRNGRKVGDPLPPRKASTNLTPESSERVNVASADKHGRVGTVQMHHARTTRSLPSGIGRSSSPSVLLRLMDSRRGSLDHSAFAFLHYPSFHSDSNSVPTSTSRSNANELSPSAGDVSTTSFDFLVTMTPQSGSSKIVFASNRDGSMQIYVMNADGTGQTRLTSDGSNNDNPRWSPNGTKILFQSDRDNLSTGFMDVYVMNADGSSVARLTTDANDDSGAVWSPDGTKIAFQSLRNTSFYQVYSMNADGSNQLNLTNTSFSESQPSWSPDGTKIAFASERDRPGFKSVYVMNSNGSNQHRVTFSSGEFEDTQPVWSRDGSKIAFVSTRDSALETWQETDDDGNVLNRSKLHLNKELYLMNVDGSGQTRLTSELANDDSPSWSPDGSKIVFRSDRDRDWTDPSAQLWTMNADGSSQTSLSNSANGDYSASWASGSANQQPVANAGGPYNAVTAQSISFNGGGSFDPDGSITSYAWNFGDGGTGSGVTPAHAYTTAGTYNVSLFVTDNSGATASATATAAITQANQPPVADAGGPYSAATAQAITLNGGGSSDPDGTIASYSWTFGDGGTGSGVTPIHAYAAAGTYNVTLTVTDNQGAQASATTTASVTTVTADFFTQNFIQVALSRTPNPDEVNYWEDIFRAAYAHQQGSMMIAVREMARTVFESAEYADRGRDNHWYVYDLYETYLMRYPDAPGWGFWEGQCNAYGREQVRRAFDECGEFAGNVAAIQPTGSASSGVYSLQSSRVNPENQPGNQLLTRDAEWSASLLSLPGRAGLDLGLGLSYSSAVWTRSGPYAYFDEDNGTPSPGFRLGFPTVQEVFFDAQVGVNVRMLITGSGQRVELRQVGTSNVYEAADSSYLQLIDYGGSLLVRSTDGTQMSYVKLQDEWRCTQIEDRNGNLISIVNDWRGDIQNITDTLGRTLTFNYDANVNLASITQAGRTEPWVTFGWSTVTIAPPFSGLVGTGNGEVIPALASVNFADGSYDKFLYNPSGQVSQITHYVFDVSNSNHVRSRTILNYGGADDVTRLTNIHVAAENWTGINGVPAEVVTEFGIEGTAHTLNVVGDPNGTVYKESYGTGWQRGLVVSAEVLAGGAPQKTTTTSWAKDANTSNNFPTNPRVIETNVIDSANNHSRTTIAYDTFALPSGVSCSLPADVYEYAANATTVARRTHTDYNLAVSYLNARVIGLPQAKLLYEGTSTLMARTTYEYDSGGQFMQDLPVIPIQHDGNYSTDFVLGRGNLVKVLRWDVSDASNTVHTESKAGYDIAGSVRFTRDALDHQTTINYTDAFSAGGTVLDAPRSFASFAYPTTVTDPDGYSLSLWYRYDFGARTRAQGPPPANQPNGLIQTFNYDDAARIKQITTVNTGAYTRYVYGPTYIQSYGSVNNVADEAYSIRVFDGAGRPFAVATNHPGSIGGYSAVYSIHDVTGRVIKQSSPTEVTGGWAPTGDDVVGWIFTQQTYDWKGRPLLTVNPSITANLNDVTTKEASYSACGCAGSEIVTLEDEVGRIQKVYSDVLGRQWKTEIMDGASIYSTSVSVYNGRDQIVRVKQYSGAAPADASSTNVAASCPTGSCQEGTMSYDGYGRLKTKHVPEQQVDVNNSSSSDHTTWVYNSDDTIQSLTDARGASANYTYTNNRRLVNLITYSAPAGITPTANVSFEYDAVGNRKLMADGSGSVSYSYSQLSQVASETRQFNGLAGSYTLAYEYALSGAVNKVTDQTAGTSFSNSLDNSDQVSGVSTVGYGGGVTQFASQMRYRASGGLKSMSYANGTSLSLGYNSRGAMSSFTRSGASYSGTTPLPVAGAYQYYDDGRLKFAQDQGASNSIKDRAYQYDHEGRLREAYSGSEARDFINQTNSGAATGPYRESFNYDAWENTLSSGGRFWSRSEVTTASFNQANRNPNWSYDAEGNVTSRNEGQNPLQSPQYSYDAAGRKTSVSQTGSCWLEPQHVVKLHTYKNSQTYDGDGQLTRYLQENHIGLNNSPEMGWPVTTFYLRSTVLGGRVISQYQGFSGEPQWNGTYVYAGGQRIGFLSSYGQGFSRNFWRSADPLTGDEVNTTDNGVVSTQSTLDAQGVEVGLSDPFPPPGEGDGVCVEYDPTFNPPERFAAQLIPDGPSARCVVDGIEQNCQLVSSEAAVQCPNNDCGPRVLKDGTLSQTFQSFADGWSGFLPQGAIYDGSGQWHILSGDRDNDLEKQRQVRPEDGVYGLSFNHASSLPQNPSKLPCAPTGTELKANDQVRNALEQALTDSLPGNMQNMHEENGYIFADKNNKLTFIRGEPGRPISQGPLRSSNTTLESTPVVPWSWLVGMFHTHPAREGLQDPTSPPGFLYTDPSKPSPGDPVAARKMGVPELIAYRGKNGKFGITAIGPKRALWVDNRGCR